MANVAPLNSDSERQDNYDRNISSADLEASEGTAHLISRDPWYQVGFVLTTGVNSAYVLGYSGIIMVPLGWIAGAIGLIVAAALSLYANVILARLHETGGSGISDTAILLVISTVLISTLSAFLEFQDSIFSVWWFILVEHEGF